MTKLWSKLKTNHSRIFVNNTRQRTDYPREKRTEHISRERGIESQLREAAQRAYRDQEDATDPMMAPQDCEGEYWNSK